MMNDYRSVLVHVSGSDRSSRVLAVAAVLAAGHGAALHAVHAVEPLYLGAHLSPETAMVAFQLRQDDDRERTSRARGRVLDAAQSHGMLIDFDSPGGDPAEAVIVMGGYGHTRTYELVLGGVTRTMLRSMAVPVLMSH